jgi:hypothetical protein
MTDQQEQGGAAERWQSQAPLMEQLWEVERLAVVHGYYDAADWIVRSLNRSVKPRPPEKGNRHA